MDEERVAKSLQELVSSESDHLVSSFLVIVEAEMPSDMDATAYHVWRKGSPAGQLGLVEYLGAYVHEHVLGVD